MESPPSSLCMATCMQGASPSACAWLSSASAEKQSAPSRLFFHWAGCFKNAAIDRFAPCRGGAVSRISSLLRQFHPPPGCCVCAPDEQRSGSRTCGYNTDDRYVAVRNAGGGCGGKRAHRVTWLAIFISANCIQGRSRKASNPHFYSSRSSPRVQRCARFW